MEEMLANQYFMMRKYNLAAKELERAFQFTHNLKLAKKLIICYTQINKPREALDLFLSIISTDLELIINTDPQADDCPCPVLVTNIEDGIVTYENEFTKFYVLGILLLYCNEEASINYFEKAKPLNPSESKIEKILETLKKNVFHSINKSTQKEFT